MTEYYFKSFTALESEFKKYISVVFYPILINIYLPIDN